MIFILYPIINWQVLQSSYELAALLLKPVFCIDIFEGKYIQLVVSTSKSSIAYLLHLKKQLCLKSYSLKYFLRIKKRIKPVLYSRYCTEASGGAHICDLRLETQL